MKKPQFNSRVAQYTLKVVNAYRHDRSAFTEGLVYIDGGYFYESTGLEGHSNIRKVRLSDGTVLKKVNLASQYFGEGIVPIGGKIYQLTWQSHVGFIYKEDTFEKIGDFRYDGEGWALTTDGKQIIMSDGTSVLRFVDPKGFKVTRTLKVTLNGQPIDQINELEWIRGEVWANIWQQDVIIRIDPATGVVTGVINCMGLLPARERATDTDVLNGIAYDAKGNRIFVTGKLWPKLYEVKLVEAR